MSRERRLGMVSRDDPLSVARQCKLLGVCRRAVYRPAKSVRECDLALMRRMDELHTDRPIYGSRQMVAALQLEGVRTGRKRVRRLMRIMELVAVAPKPATSLAAPSHAVFPYLLRGMAITEPNLVWCADITYIPMRGGFMYLVAVMDWATRFVLSWRLSNCMDVRFCLDALDEALHGGVAPRILNTDQGAQFTGAGFTDAVQAAGARVSMDGMGRWRDNVVIERLWRSLKCEAVYLHDLSDGLAAHKVIGAWMRFYNEERPHSALGGRTPRMAYEGRPLPLVRAA